MIYDEGKELAPIIEDLSTVVAHTLCKRKLQ